MTSEDTLKLCAGLGLMIFGVKITSDSLSGVGALEYRGTTKKADQRNDHLLSRVNVIKPERHACKGCQAHNDQCDQATDVTARYLGVVGQGRHQGRQVGIDDSGPVYLLATFGNNFVTRLVSGVIGGCRYGFAHAHSLKRLKLENLHRNGSAA